MKTIMLVLLAGVLLGGCEFIAAGFVGIEIEKHRQWCIQHYGNPDCYGVYR